MKLGCFFNHYIFDIGVIRVNINISIAIICKDEERVIKRCIDAISEDISARDEIIVVDTGSTDCTLEILSEYNNLFIYDFKWVDDFAAARNFAISKATLDWVFFIDSDEVLVSGSLDNLRKTIQKCMNKPNPKDTIVFSPRVINSDDTVVYNAGRIVPNDDTVEYAGCIHEYPIVKNTNSHLVPLKLADTIVKHDGYEIEVLESKNKAIRNTVLIKKILKRNPDSSRYYYFYYRDAKPLLSEKEYEEGMVDFFKKFPDDIYANQVAKDLADFYIGIGEYDNADQYIEMLFESADKGNVDDRYLGILLMAVSEIQKTKIKQRELLELLIYSKGNLLDDKELIFQNGYSFDDLIGLLFFQLEEYETAHTISEKLSTTKYSSNISEIFEKLGNLTKKF